MFEELQKRLLLEWGKQGRIMAAGFAAYRVVTKLPVEQVDNQYFAYMAGAQHLFSAVMAILDADVEPTEQDMELMSKINAELEKWAIEAKIKLNMKEH